jgi:hypothetical protein
VLCMVRDAVALEVTLNIPGRGILQTVVGRVGSLFGGQQEANESLEERLTAETDSPSGPDPRLLRVLLVRRLRSLGADSWFTKKHTRGVRRNYADALSKLGTHSRRWATAWYGHPWA